MQAMSQGCAESVVASTLQQGSEAWIKFRLGKVTASRIGDMMAKTRTGWGASRKNYMAELVIERLTGVPFPSYQSAAMLAGIEAEPEARAAYAFQMNVDVEKVGAIPHPTIKWSSASPDGFVGNDGLIEIKAPTPATHLETLLHPDLIAQDYLYQMRWQMACTGRKWCDFVSYEKNFPEPMRLSVARVLRNDDAIAELEKEVQKFLAEVDATEATLREKYGLPDAPKGIPARLSEPSTPTGLTGSDSPRNDAGAMLLLEDR